MPDKNLGTLLKLYNPWVDDPKGNWRASLPKYRRPMLKDLIADIMELPQIISITGPRRVGKTTALRQLVCHLIDEMDVAPSNILYFSFDDPEVFGSVELQRVIFDKLIEHMKVAPQEKIVRYFLLDEIQRLPKWELFLKRYYDLKFPVRFIISGSASSTIFRQSQESLLGRIKDRHLLPFSFREYCFYQLQHKRGFSRVVNAHAGLRQLLIEARGDEIVSTVKCLERELEDFEKDIRQAIIAYCREGGFPEVWVLKDPVRKIEYLMEQQVRKVLYEDLMALTQYRKPENVLRFFVYLLAHPGNEINMSTLAKEIGVERRVIEDNFPRLIMTDLIIRIQKFSHQPLRVRQGNIKCYPVDLALRNAVLKTWDDFTSNATMMGMYAENLVAQEVCKWPEAVEVAFYREKSQEVDFVITHGGNRYLPIEVKHRLSEDRAKGLHHFMKKYNLDFGVVITRDRNCRFAHGILYLPLRYFLLVN